MRTAIRLVAIGLSALYLLAACGFKGPLYQPNAEPAKKSNTINLSK